MITQSIAESIRATTCKIDCIRWEDFLFYEQRKNMRQLYPYFLLKVTQRFLMFWLMVNYSLSLLTADIRFFLKSGFTFFWYWIFNVFVCLFICATLHCLTLNSFEVWCRSNPLIFVYEFWRWNLITRCRSQNNLETYISGAML